MKWRYFTALSFIFIFLFSACAATSLKAADPLVLKATTEDGRKVLLFPNKTWMYEGKISEPADSSASDRSRKVPAGSTKVLKGKRGFYELWYDPSIWAPLDKNRTKAMNPEAEYTLTYMDGDAYVMTLAERIQIPIDQMKEIVVKNASAAYTDVKITFEEKELINDKEFLVLHMEAKYENIPLMCIFTIWSGEQGTLQVYAFTTKNLYNEYEEAFREIQKGIKIVE